MGLAPKKKLPKRETAKKETGRRRFEAALEEGLEETSPII